MWAGTQHLNRWQKDSVWSVRIVGGAAAAPAKAHSPSTPRLAQPSSLKHAATASHAVQSSVASASAASPRGSPHVSVCTTRSSDASSTFGRSRASMSMTTAASHVSPAPGRARARARAHAVQSANQRVLRERQRHEAGFAPGARSASECEYANGGPTRSDRGQGGRRRAGTAPAQTMIGYEGIRKSSRA